MSTTTRHHTATLAELFTNSFHGLSVDADATDVDRARLARRLRGIARRQERPGFRFDEANLAACHVRPFDLRWTYDESPRARVYREHIATPTDWLAIEPRGTTAPFIARNAVAGEHVRVIPMYVSASGERVPNLTREARQHALRHGVGETELFHHAVAVLFAEPRTTRIPLPDSKALIRFSAVIGYRVASLFADEPAVLALRKDDQELRAVGVASRVGKEARMLRGSVLAVDDAARAVERDYATDELVAMSDHARANGTTTGEVIDLLGARTFDVYLNDKAYWRNVPSNVWKYMHGSTAVLPAWLRDRRESVIERTLLRDEVSQFTTATRRIASLLLLQPALRRNLEAL